MAVAMSRHYHPTTFWPTIGQTGIRDEVNEVITDAARRIKSYEPQHSSD